LADRPATHNEQRASTNDAKIIISVSIANPAEMRGFFDAKI
jgi:hypothetical protein